MNNVAAIFSAVSQNLHVHIKTEIIDAESEKLLA